MLWKHQQSGLFALYFLRRIEYIEKYSDFIHQYWREYRFPLSP